MSLLEFLRGPVGMDRPLEELSSSYTQKTLEWLQEQSMKFESVPLLL